MKGKEEEAQAYRRLVSSLKLAKREGMHVVLLSSDLAEVVPDLMVDMSNAEQIGRTQAQQLVGKLELDKASSNSPRSIEVLIPSGSPDSDQHGEDSAESSAEAFAQQSFKGIWQVLAPYFKDGRAVSPSGRLDAHSGEDSWRAVAFDPGTDTGASAKQMSARLETDARSSGAQRIDGVIAMNDFIASGVMDALGDMGYTGSSADVNPQISIGDIVGNMTGRKDLQRHPVPRPQASKTPGASKGETDGHGGAAEDTSPSDQHRWPIVTGYGAYIDNIPEIVNGRQWMTGLEDRHGLAASLAEACWRLNTGQGPASLPGVSDQERMGRHVPVLSLPLIAVSASNLKSTLIDTGYVKPAEAGL
ncbi:substrate-binding domain-containing protein [Bifidobacterium xylocopae]|nr:substrate-binding domain-containing protein [Bifidobacterium xylocopae]